MRGCNMPGHMKAQIVVLDRRELHERLIRRTAIVETPSIAGSRTQDEASRARDRRGLIVIQITQPGREAFQDVLARVNGALHDGNTIDTVVLGSVTVNFMRRQVLSSGTAIHLTAQEFELLRYLAAHRDRVVTRDELLREVWKYPGGALTRSVDNAISRLRKKIEPCPQVPRYIHTMHRDGYCLTPTRTGGNASQPDLPLAPRHGAA